MFESLENVLMQIMQSLHRQEQMMQLVITHLKIKMMLQNFLVCQLLQSVTTSKMEDLSLVNTILSMKKTI